MRLKRNHQIGIMFLLALAVIGVVSPFAFGSAPDVSSAQKFQHSRQTLNALNHMFQKPRSYAAKTAIAESAATSPSGAAPRSRIGQFVSSLRPTSGKKDGSWKGGESKATIPSRLIFAYVSPLLELASKRTLTEEDSFDVADSLRMDHSVDSLATVYDQVRRKAHKKIEEQREKGADSVKKSQSILLLKALVKQQRGMLILTFFLRLLNTGVQAFPAILVSRLLRSIEAGNSVPASKAFSAAFMLLSVLTLKMVTENQFFHNVVNMSTKTRGSLEGLIFDKSLRLPEGGSGVLTKQAGSEEKKALGSGGVINLMQSDASIIESAAMQVHTIWDGPLQIAIYTSLLYKYLGPSVSYGLAVLLTVIPLNSITLRILDKLSRAENEARDARTKRTTESISNMKLLKVQGWEEQFANDIRGHRTDELNRHKTRGIIRAINSAVSNAVPALVLVVTLTAYAKTGRPIVASTIFTAISLFNQLRFPLFFYPMLIDALANGKNSLRRISSYLTSEELVQYVETVPPTNGGSVDLKNGNFLWSTSEEPIKDGEVSAPEAPALCNVNMEVNPGEMVAVMGSVGSGKSALIKALLGELAPVPRMVVDRTAMDSGSDSGIDRPSVTMHGKVAYCSQEAWLPKGSIRDAIVFGREYDDDRYRSAIYDAGLDKDMDPKTGVLSDSTDVGEGGSGLSGGQRARVALARALYSDDETKVFLLDDCLAALDATVGSLVFERITKRFKDSQAAAIIVTNDPSIPRRCDKVILMGPTQGRKPSISASTCSTIIDTGTYDALLRRGHKLQSYSDLEVDVRQEPSVSFVRTENPNMLSAQGDVDLIETPLQPPDMIRIAGGYKVNATCIDSAHADPETEIDCRNYPDSMADRVMSTMLEAVEGDEEAERHSNTLKKSEDMAEKGSEDAGTAFLSTDDSMSTEAVPFSTYIGYLKAVRSPFLMGAMVLAFVTANGAQFFQQYTVAKWTDLARGDAMAAALGGTYLQSLVYAAGVVSVFLWLRSYLTMLVGARASTFYHDRMVNSVFQAPMSFFDSTPSGQILSRFGKEIGTVDRALPDSLASVLFCALQIGSSVLALAGAITPVMMVPMIFAGSLYFRTMKRFRPAARDLKRSETKTRSPIFTHFGEALRGTEVIRSIPGAISMWSRQHRKLSDKNLSVFSTIKALDRWLSVSLEFLGNSMVFFAAIASVVLSRAGKLQPGSAGWGLTQSLAITGLMAWAVRNLTMLESHMMSVMRVRELTDLDSEEADILNAPGSHKSKMPRELKGVGEALAVSFPSTDKPKLKVAPLNDGALKADGWPWKGGVLFKNVSMRYNPSSPLVLKEVTIRVPPGSTLGVVGRTGSGKSSLLLTLFRIVEIENGGSVEIDGIDIRSVSMQTLRESLSIIPQDPVLFAGTIGYNLDATGKASEEDMWEALEAASPELAKQFRESEGLASPISEGGNNLSQGQRQLICLARALLRKSKILVMDEATSSVDATTDLEVQATIRREFVEKGVSVITVAHRLDTVLGYDRIAVLGDGKLLEYGAPSELLKSRNGELRQLVDADRRNKMKGGKAAEAVPVGSLPT